MVESVILDHSGELSLPPSSFKMERKYLNAVILGEEKLNTSEIKRQFETAYVLRNEILDPKL